MDAPSERHLEDYLWGHPEAFGVHDYPPQYEGDPIYKLVFRQFQLPSGIVDLVGFDWRLCCFELKKGPVTSRALTQLLRYMEDMKHCLISFLFERCRDDEVMRAWMRQEGYPRASELPLLTGVLVGNGLEDDNLLIAAGLLNIEVFLYTYDGADYVLENIQYTLGRHNTYHDVYSRIANGPLGDRLFNILRPDMERAYQDEQKRNHRTSFVDYAAGYVEGLMRDES